MKTIQLARCFAARAAAKTSLLSGLAFFAWLAPVDALAQKNSGTASGPTVIPAGTFATSYVISQPGAYVLGGNRLLTDPTKHIIEINAHDVTLDLGGFSLAHPAGGGASQGHGVYVPATENVEIRNGSIVNAAEFGIAAFSGKGLRVIDVRVVSAEQAGIASIVAAGHIDRCEIADSRYGILAAGMGSLVTDCVVSDSADVGVQVTMDGRIIRSNVRGGNVGIALSGTSSVTDCAATGAVFCGVAASGYSTIRNTDMVGNGKGLVSGSTAVVLIGSRISNNTTNVQGNYTNGGGNVVQ